MIFDKLVYKNKKYTIWTCTYKYIMTDNIKFVFVWI